MTTIQQQTILDEIIKNYSELAYVDEFSQIHKGYTCEKWMLTSKDRKFFLKRFDKKNTKQRLDFITESQNYISKLAYYAPRVYYTKEKDRFIECGDYYFVLQEYIDGQSFKKSNLNDGDIYNIGLFLGKIHKLFYDYTLYTGDDCKLKLDIAPLPKIKQLIEYHQKNGKDQLCIDSLTYKLEQLSRFDIEKVSGFTNLPEQVIHGDFYLENIIFNENKQIKSIVDFDQSSRFYRVYELMRAIMFLIFENQDIDLFESRLHILLNGYLDVNYLLPIEIENMVNLYYWIQLCDTFCFAPSTNPKHSIQALKTFGEYRIQILKWITKNLDTLNEIVLDIYRKKNKVHVIQAI